MVIALATSTNIGVSILHNKVKLHPIYRKQPRKILIIAIPIKVTINKIQKRISSFITLITPNALLS